VSVLHAAARKALASKQFAEPGARKYPIPDRSHAANAKARASGKPEQATVDAAVARKYPDMGKKKAGPTEAKKLAGALHGK
jgi:hypothetical protein